ncbi:MAG: hypothetical protein QMD73_09915 [Rhodocyclaceae bacterium]|nr:hypothetical protein [Rhodocyclaceae bacterium]
MKQATTFLERVRPAIDPLPDGADKDTLLALAEAQDTLSRSDAHPKQRALAMRRLTGGAAIVASRNAAPPQAKGHGKKP